MNNDDFNFAHWLRTEMDKRGWDELDLAIESYISEQSIRYWLQGDRYPNLYNFLQIIHTFGKRVEIVDDK